MTANMDMSNPMSSDTKNVQTELNRGEYERLRELAEAENISIKEALRRATNDWIDRHDSIAADDSLFTFHDSYEVPTSGPTDAASIEAELYDP